MSKQKLNAMAIANTLAIITAIAYIICAVVLRVSKDFAIILVNYLFHGIDVTNIIVMRGIGYTAISIIFGVIVMWIFGYLFAVIYNKFVK